MDDVLLTITTLSLGAAAGFGFLSWRVSREEREREQARIAALSSALTSSSPRGGCGEPGDAPVETRVAVGSVFERATEGLRGRPGIKLAVGGVMALTIVIGAIIGARMGGAPDSPTVTRNGAAVAANASAPLELMSMRYQRQGTTLTVSGLIRNPAKSAAMNGVTAVVFAFDRSGAFVASGRAPIDFSALAPGDESPFLVNVANVSDVARYRVTFRSANGVVRHIDRRGGGQVQLAQAVR
jgi:hypothetical protein